jgi:hypothetical protein
MNNEDRIAIEDVFSRLQEVERQGGPRDPEAEQFIRARLDAQPGAAYYLAQTVLVQEHALKAAQQKISELEQGATAQPAPSQDGFAAGAARQSGLSAGYFGRTPPPDRDGRGASGGAPLSAAGTPLSAAGTPIQGGMPPGGSQFSQAAAQQAAPSRAGGFLAGAAQTAMGVAGGMMLGNLIGGLFGGGSHGAGANHLSDATPQIKDEPAADAKGGQEQTSDPQFDPPNDAPQQDVAYDDSDSFSDGGSFFDDGSGDYDDV